MDRKELIKKYIEFFKKQRHQEIKNSSLLPENDSTVLFTTAGMHPLVPFILGQSHPLGKKLTNVQRCIRTGDIEEVGDTTHHTLFEMLGNWSLGDYGKKEAIQMSFEFLTKILKIPINKLAITIFKGDNNSPKDEESGKIWEKLGIPKDKIVYLSKSDNWWETTSPGPCGPDTEIFYWKLNNTPIPEKFNPKDKNWVEIWNNVFMQYEKTKENKYIKAKQKNIDTGMGVERTVTLLNGFEDNYKSDMWKPIIERIEKISGKKYAHFSKEMRIIADHIKAATFIINDGIVPGNSEQGYVLRRLIRRAIRNLRKLEVDFLKINATNEIAKEIIQIYDDYKLNENLILNELKKEDDKFQKTLDKGLKEFEKITKNKILTGKQSFLLYQSYGFPLEMIEEIAKEKKIKFDSENFQTELKKHQKLSKTAAKGKFSSGLADNSEQTIKLHTTCHLLLAALQKTLGKDIQQKGSNITSERLRFDFNFPRKLTEKEKEKIEKLVNAEIKKNQKIIREEMTLKEAKEKNAIGIFDEKYGGIVSVYTIGNFSKEICTGPHVKNTSELGIFRIKKESSSSAGVRRIKAVLE